MRRLCVVVLVAMIVVWVPTAALAIDSLTMTVFDRNGTLVNTCGPFSSSTDTLTIPNCAPFRITKTNCASCTGPEVAAITGTSENQLVVRNTLIKNVSGGTSGFVSAAYSIRIEAVHTFTLGIDPVTGRQITVTDPRNYGAALQAIFGRGTLFSPQLASGDNVSKKAYYGFLVQQDIDGGGNILAGEDQIGVGDPGTPTDDVQAGVPAAIDNAFNLLSYTVPASGSTTLNTLPVPSQHLEEPATGSTDTRECRDLVVDNNCVPQLERLREVVSAFLAGGPVTNPTNGDTVRLDNAPAFVANTPALRDARSATFTPQVVVLQNSGQQATTWNPFDQGWATLIVRCTPSFDCTLIDLSTLAFGPDGAVPSGFKFRDENKDGVVDLLMKVRTPETGIACGDTGATLTGKISFATLPNPVDFNLVVGFLGTGPGCE